MKLLTLLLLGSFTGACSNNTTGVQQNEIKPLIERVTSCNHFSGEFGGDNSDRDKEVSAEMDALKCSDLDKELAVAKEKYQSNPEILNQLNQASAQE